MNTLITGGTKGIGSVIRDTLSKRGDKVFTLSREERDDEYHISVDLSDKSQINKIVDKIGDSLIDNLIFSHRYRGQQADKEYKITIDAISLVIENIKKRFNKTVSIVIIGSNASRFILPEQSLSYHSSRSALESLTRFYAVKYGPIGVRCNCVIVGGTIKKPENKSFFNKDNPVKKLMENILPIKKMGKAEDISYLVEFLCNKKSSFITGQSITIDGGLSIIGQESIARELSDLNHKK